MEFALNYLNAMERKYPGTLAMMEKNPSKWMDICINRKVDPADFNGMRALMRWRGDKVIYNFNPTVASEVFQETEAPNYKIPVTIMRHLPYPCIALKIMNFDIISPFDDRQLEVYTGNAFIWTEGDALHSAWEFDNGNHNFVHAHIDLKDGWTLARCTGFIMEKLLRQHFSTAEVAEIKKEIGDFGDGMAFDEGSYDRLETRFGSRFEHIKNAYYLSRIQETLTQRVIHYILYLNCNNADIESVEEKLKAGAWASILGEETKEVKRAAKRQALRENEGTIINDVGYRIAGKFKRSYSGEGKNKTGNETGTKRGYGKRRAHYHHFWIGPRDGAIAEDIMNPCDGERGLVLYWLDATEIHPELKDEKATIVPVE